jgi:hypothetical protein
LFLDYVWDAAFVFAEHDDLDRLRDALRCLSIVIYRETTDLPRSDPRVSVKVPRLLGYELHFSFDNDEQYEGLFDDIVELQAFLCAANPAPAVEMIMAVFSDCTNLSVFHWCLKVASGFYRLSADDNPDFFRPMLERILGSPALVAYVQESALIASEVCRAYLYLPDPAGGFAAFQMATALYSADDDVMRLAVKLAQKYHFPIDSITTLGSKMSFAVLRTAVSLAPGAFVQEWLGILMSDGSDLSLATASAVICGLLDVADFDVEPFLEAFASRHLFRDAIKIARKNALNCVRVLAAAASWQTDQESSFAFFRTVLRVARGLVSPDLTDLVLKIVPPESLTDYKIGVRVSELLTQHAIDSVPLTPDSVVALVQCIASWALDSWVAVNNNVSEGLIRTLSFSFEMAYRLISDELWVQLILRMFEPLAASARDFAQGSTVLFRFAKADVERYLAIMRNVLSRASNPDVLLELVHAELFTRTDLSEVGQMVLFEEKLHALAKTYLYMERFV